MTEIYYEQRPEPVGVQTGTSRKPKSARKPRWIVWSVSVLVFGAMTAGGFALAKHYMDGIGLHLTDIESKAVSMNQSIETLKAQLNEQKEDAAALQLKFQGVQQQLEAVKEQMSLAGDTLNATDETKKALSARITDLSKELEGLRKLIQKLEEAARVY